MTWRSRLLLGCAALALVVGGAWMLAGKPEEAWAEAVHEPGSAPVAASAQRRAMPALVADRQSVAAGAVAASASRAAERPRTVAAADQPQASEAQPPAASVMPPPMPMAAPAALEPAGSGEPTEPGSVAAAVEPSAPAPASAAPSPPQAEADPIAEVRRLAAQAASRPRSPPPPPAPDPERARLAAMVTDLSAITKQVLERQVQAERAAEAAQAGMAKRLADIEQRLTFAEARAAVSATVAAAASPAVAAPGVQPPVADPARSAPSGPRAPVAGPQSYRITAASPGLAYLAVQNPMPGQQPVLEVRVGDEVPGLGKVARIGQRGTAWEVQTAGGTIERQR